MPHDRPEIGRRLTGKVDRQNPNIAKQEVGSLVWSPSLGTPLRSWKLTTQQCRQGARRALHITVFTLLDS